MSKIVARFYVIGFEKKAGESSRVTLNAVTSKENARWSQYTPSGQITMDLTRKASGARSTFDEMVGKECLVTFDFDAPPAEDPEYRREGEPDQLGYVSDEE
jgi:hypothetical protein